MSNIEGIIGSNGDDTITGNDSNNALLGWRGYDTIYGMGGDDHLASSWDGGRLEGGLGNDTYYYAYTDVTTIIDSGGDADEVVITTRDMDGAGYWSSASYFEGTSLVFESNGNNDTADNELIILNGSEIGSSLGARRMVKHMVKSMILMDLEQFILACLRMMIRS